MATRNTSFVVGEHYHIYNRGSTKQQIFLDTSDFDRFQILLYLSNTSEQFNVRDLSKTYENIFTVEKDSVLVRIGAYCLMPNHFHILLSPAVENGLSKFMLKLCTAYSMYFNTKYERTGTLYEGAFKSKYIGHDEYLKYLFSYIHLNPVARKSTSSTIFTPLYTSNTFEKASAYPYSSLADYLSPRGTLGLSRPPVDTEVYDIYFNSKQDMKHELFDWLRYEEPALGEP